MPPPPPSAMQQAGGRAHGPRPALPQPGAPAMPLALPPNVLATLSAIPPDQLVAVIQLIQSGHLALPPQRAAQAGPPQPTPTAPVPATPSAPAERDMSQTRRRVSGPQGSSQRGQADAVPADPSAAAAAASTGQPTAASPRDSDGAPTRRGGVDAGAAARNFVLQMHRHGYTFDQLAAEIPNRKALTRMYKTLGLPTARQSPPPAPSPPTQRPPLGDDGATAGSAELRKASVTRRPPVAKPAAPASREEYLAKLAAARTSKGQSAAAAKTQPAQPSPPVSTQPVPPPKATQTAAQRPSIAPPAPARVSEPATPVPTPKSKMPPNVQTELIKQRLAALKARGAANKASTTNAATQQTTEAEPAATSMSQPTGLGSGLTPSRVNQPPPASAAVTTTPQPPQPLVASTSSAQPTFSPAPPTLNRSFSGLPGLFMAGSPPQPPCFQPASNPPPAAAPQQPSLQAVEPSVIVSSSPARSPAPLNLDRKRPAAMAAEGPAASAFAKRPTFGNSAENSETTSLIIEVSDDGEDGEEMDIDPEPAMSRFYLPGLPPRPSFGSSVPGTPPISTPGGMAQAQIDAQIAAMKRQIAEKEAEARARKAGRAKAATSEEASRLSSPAPPQSAGSTAAVTDGVAVTETSAGTKSAASSARSDTSTARQEEMAKLQAKLRSVNARLAGEEGEAAVATETADNTASGAQVGTVETTLTATKATDALDENTARDDEEGHDIVRLPAAQEVRAVHDSQTTEVQGDAEDSEAKSAAAAAAEVAETETHTMVDEEMDIDSDSDTDSESDSEEESSTDDEAEAPAAAEQPARVSSDNPDGSSAQSEEQGDERFPTAAEAVANALGLTEQAMSEQDVEAGEAMDEDDDYEPEPVYAEAAAPVSPSPDTAASSGEIEQPRPTAAEAVEKTDIADDLAPELQPTASQQLKLDDDVGTLSSSSSGEETDSWSGIY